jgi:hypothetical protein
MEKMKLEAERIKEEGDRERERLREKEALLSEAVGKAENAKLLIKELEDKLASESKKRASAEDNAKMLAKESESLKEQLRQKVGNAEEDESNKRDDAERNSMLEALQSALDTAQLHNEQTQGKLAKAEALLEEKTREVAEVQKVRDAAIQEADAHSQKGDERLVAALDENRQLRDKVTLMEAELKDAKKSVEAAKMEADALKEELDQKQDQADGESRQLSSELIEIKTELKTLRIDNDTAKATEKLLREQLLAQAEEAETEREELEREMQTLRRSAASVSSEVVTKSRQDMDKLREKLAEEVRAREEVEDRSQKLHTRVLALQADLEIARAERKELESLVNTLRTQGLEANHRAIAGTREALGVRSHNDMTYPSPGGSHEKSAHIKSPAAHLFMAGSLSGTPGKVAKILLGSSERHRLATAGVDGCACDTDFTTLTLLLSLYCTHYTHFTTLITPILPRLATDYRRSSMVCDTHFTTLTLLLSLYYTDYLASLLDGTSEINRVGKGLLPEVYIYCTHTHTHTHTHTCTHTHTHTHRIWRT